MHRGMNCTTRRLHYYLRVDGEKIEREYLELADAKRGALFAKYPETSLTPRRYRKVEIFVSRFGCAVKVAWID